MIANTGENGEQLKPSDIADENVKSGGYFGKDWQFFKK